MRDFRAALESARMEHIESAVAQRILDQLEAWVIECGLDAMEQRTV
jgi:hypothetical protein